MWTRERLLEFLQTEDLPDQRIDLPYGLFTRGVSLEKTCQTIFEDVRGKAVLTVGSSLGYFCFEALRRGARRAVGCDVSPERVRQARLLADCLDLPAEFCQGDVEKEIPGEGFDVVVCVGLLHKLKDPIKVLDHLIAVTREKLILEFPGPESPASLGFLKEQGMRWWNRRSLTKLPIIVVGRKGTSSEYPEQKFYFSRDAMRHLLTNHRRQFAAVTFPKPQFKGHCLVVGRRRRIKRLVVLAGPSGSGKSTLVRRLKEGDTEIVKPLGLGDISSWTIGNKYSLAHNTDRAIDRLIFHYDFLSPWRNSAKVWERDESLQLLDSADEIVFVTFWADMPTLRRRIQARRIQPATDMRNILWTKLRSVLRLYCSRRSLSLFSYRKAKRRIRSMQQLISSSRDESVEIRRYVDTQAKNDRFYKSETALDRSYEGWFRFCETYPSRAHWIVDTTPTSPGFYAASEWLDSRRDHLQGASTRISVSRY